MITEIEISNDETIFCGKCGKNVNLRLNEGYNGTVSCYHSFCKTKCCGKCAEKCDLSNNHDY